MQKIEPLTPTEKQIRLTMTHMLLLRIQASKLDTSSAAKLTNNERITAKTENITTIGPGFVVKNICKELVVMRGK